MKTKQTTIRKARLRYAVATLCWGACVFSLPLSFGAGTAFAEGDLDRIIKIDIPPHSSLEESLIEWGTRAKLTVMMNTHAVDFHLTQAVRGEMTAGKALTLILEGSGLTYTREGERIHIVPLDAFTPFDGINDSDGYAVRTAGRTDSAAEVYDDHPPLSSTIDQGGNGSNSDQNNSTAGLREVIVTAQRREESIDKVPISMTALSQQSMDELHIESITDLASVVPGLYLSIPSGFGQDKFDFNIRGVEGGDNAPTNQIYIDDTPIAVRLLGGAGPSDSPQPLIFDLDRVEVLRGPQGTLFGASAMGGAIRFITPQPNLEQATGSAKMEVSYTENGAPSYEAGAAYGAPLIQGVAGFRASAWYRSTGGFIDQEDPFTGRIIKANANSPGAWVVRPAFTIAPKDGLSFTMSAYLQHRDSQNPNSYWTTLIPNPERNAHVWGGTSQPLTDDLRVVSLDVNYDFSGMSFHSGTSYLSRAERTVDDFTQIASFIYGNTDYQNPALAGFHSAEDDSASTVAWQQEFRLSSKDDSARINWVFGTYFRHATNGVQQVIPPDFSPVTELLYGQTYTQYNYANDNPVPDYIYNGQAATSYADFHTVDVSEAIFGDVALNLTSQLKIDVGVRAERTIVEDQDEVSGGPLNGVAYQQVVLPDARSTPVTPRVSMTYQYTDSGMAYVSAAKGYRPGGSNEITTVDNPQCDMSLHQLGLTSVPLQFASDSLWSYEIGTKDQFFNKRLSVQGSIYFIDWTNIQSGVNLPSCSESYTGNRGKAISKGFDLQMVALVTDGFKLTANVGYTDAYYPDAAYSLPNSPGATPPLLNGAGEKIVPTVPWTVAAVADYSRDISSLWNDSRSYLRLDYRWQSKTTSRDPLDAGYNPADEPFPDPAFGLMNIRLGLTHGGLDLSLFVSNLMNSDPILAYVNLKSSDPLFRANALPPRTFGITGWFHF